jgi:hypothetical protein
MPPHDGPGIELAILYSDRQSAESLLARATKMCAGLDPSIVLIAVHTVPYPCNFECPSATHAHLVNVLSELAQGCPVPVRPLVVLARSRQEGLQYALHSDSVLMVSCKRDERMVRAMAHNGHEVALLHVL